MAKLFIANCTQHNQTLFYRVDFNTNGEAITKAGYRAPKGQNIPSGQQVPLGGDLHPVVIADIIEQLRPYGLQDASQIGRLRGLVPYVYSEDTPVSAKLIKDVSDHNKGIRMAEGRDRRTKAAVAANDALTQKLNELNNPVAPQPFEVEYEQLEVSENDESPIAEGVRVDPNAAPTPPQRGRRKAA